MEVAVSPVEDCDFSWSLESSAPLLVSLEEECAVVAVSGVVEETIYGNPVLGPEVFPPLETSSSLSVLLDFAPAEVIEVEDVDDEVEEEECG